MRKIIIVSAALCCVLLSACTTKKIEPKDPEIFEKSNARSQQFIGIMPPGVKTIACISPGSYPGAPGHKKGLELLRQAGYKLKVMPHAFVREKNKNHAPVAGKVADFYAAWNDPEVDMILCIRGGMGSEDLLDNLDWNKLKKRPELYVQGYSDATLIVCALIAKNNGHPIAGSMSGSLTGITPDAIDAMRKMNHGEKLGSIKVKTLVPGDCKGKPLGGSLRKLVRLADKDYCPDLTGKIIFIESSSITPEAARKALYDLKEKKFFEKVSGVVFGKFICKPADKLQQYIKEFAVELGLPAYVDFPIGHVPQNYSIDFTRTVEIKNGEVTFPAVYYKK